MKVDILVMKNMMQKFLPCTELELFREMCKELEAARECVAALENICDNVPPSVNKDSSTLVSVAREALAKWKGITNGKD